MRIRTARTSTVLLALSVVFGTALLLWAADLVARWSVESYVERQVQAVTGALERPSVDVHGTFFLPQVLQGRYERVDVSIGELRAGPLRLEDVRAELTGVHVSFRDLLAQNPAPVYIEESRQRAVLTYEDLNRYLDVTGRPVTVEAAPDGEVVLTGTAEVFGREVSASAQAVLGSEDGALSVQPTAVDTGTVLDAASRLLLRQRFTFVVPMDPLPFGQQLTGIDAGEAGLEVEARGVGVVVRP